MIRPPPRARDVAARRILVASSRRPMPGWSASGEYGPNPYPSGYFWPVNMKRARVPRDSFLGRGVFKAGKGWEMNKKDVK